MKKNSEYYTPNKIYTHKSILYTCKFIGYQGNKPTYEIVTTNEISGFKVGDKFTPNDPEKWFDITDTFIPPTPVKETEPEQPYYKGKGEHSVNQLEAICSQYKEYVSFLNSRGNDTTPTSKEGLEDGDLPKNLAIGIESFEDAQIIMESGEHICTIERSPSYEIAEEIIKRYNEFDAMYEGLTRARDWFYLNIKKSDKQPACISEIEAILTRINKD